MAKLISISADEVQAKLADDRRLLIHQRGVMVEYLKMIMQKEDWHGVMDAAADLREIDAKLAMVKYNEAYWGT